MTVEELLARCDLVRASEKKLAECKPFSCDEGDLDEFFANDCLVNQRKLLGKTYLFCLKSQPDTIVTAFSLSNIADERLEAKYMGIGVGRLPLNTRLMYFDLLKIKVNEE